MNIYQIDVEKRVLSYLLRNPETYPEIRGILNAEDFCPGGNNTPDNRRLFVCIEQLIEGGIDINPIIISAKSGLPLGHIQKYLDLEEDDSIENYLPFIQGASLKRRMQEQGDRLKIAANSPDLLTPGDIHIVIEEVTAGLKRANVAPLENYSIQKLSEQYLQNVLENKDKSLEERITRTGFIDLDRILSIEGGDFIIVAGRPGMGKTALLSGIRNNLLLKGKRIATFSFEMTAQQLQQRYICSHTGISVKELRELTFFDNPIKVQLFLEAITGLGKFKWHIFGVKHNTVNTTFKQAIYQLHNNLDLIEVDYLQLMRHLGKHANKVSEVTAISNELKGVAQEHGLPLLAAAQLSRAVENRQDKHPQLADLRESGSLENDADDVLLLYRDEYYNPDETEKPGIAEIEIAKHRHGDTGTIELFWNGPKMAFYNLEKGEKIF